MSISYDHPWGLDAFLGKYSKSFSVATKILNDAGGHATLGQILAELDRRSVRPFYKAPDKSIYWLARHFTRASRVFEPRVTAKKATAATEVWTKEAWAKHHRNDASVQPRTSERTAA
jgi:hypothetical protein